MGFEFLFHPVEELDVWLSGLLTDAPFAVAIGIAFLLGLRHASDPDHLVAVTSLVAAGDDDGRGATRLGAWWGLGHSLVLLAIGLPLIIFKSELPGWLEKGAEIGVGVVILLLAARVCAKWLMGDYRAAPHTHDAASDAVSGERHRHLHFAQTRNSPRSGEEGPEHHRHIRTPREAFAIGVIHGLAGTGAVVVLLIAALPSRLEAAAALAVFAPMSIVSMAALTGAWAWVLTRQPVEPVYRLVLIPLLGVFGLLFGAWYIAAA